jgi:hypothetical protein
MVSFARQAGIGEAYGGSVSEYIVPTLENIGKTTARDISCEYWPWNEVSESPANFIESTANIQYLNAGDKLDLVKHRSVHVIWDTTGRGNDDLPCGIFKYVVLYSDKTHQYVSSFCVSLFGFPDQIRDDTDNDFTAELVHQVSVSLRGIRRRARLEALGESIARPIRRWKYARLARKHDALSGQTPKPDHDTERDPDAA